MGSPCSVVRFFLAFGLDVESTENEIQEKRYDIVIIDEYECIIHACK